MISILSFSTREDGLAEEFSMLAGKSNLIKAIEFMKTTITKGIPTGHTEKFCKIDKGNIYKTSYFEFEIKLDEKYYAYGFELLLNRSEFISEWLCELRPDGKDVVLFARNIETGSYESK